MDRTQVFDTEYQGRLAGILRAIHIDPVLFMALLLLTVAGLGILYSASDGSIEVVQKQGIRLALAFFVMLVVAQIPQHQLYLWTP